MIDIRSNKRIHAFRLSLLFDYFSKHEICFTSRHHMANKPTKIFPSLGEAFRLRFGLFSPLPQPINSFRWLIQPRNHSSPRHDRWFQGEYEFYGRELKIKQCSSIYRRLCVYFAYNRRWNLTLFFLSGEKNNRNQAKNHTKMRHKLAATNCPIAFICT